MQAGLTDVGKLLLDQRPRLLQHRCGARGLVRHQELASAPAASCLTRRVRTVATNLQYTRAAIAWA